MIPNRVLAVDWSGAASGAAKKIWLCEVSGGRVLRLECGRNRRSIESWLVGAVRRDPELVVGLDFAFSMPLAFLKKRGHREIDEVWREVEMQGEDWLAECPFPFWGKPGKKKPPLPDSVLLRRTESETGEAVGMRPFSVFQIGGAGAVGVGSLRGQPMLRRLRRRGFAIWPFDRPAFPLVIEIWPRVFLGSLVKSDPEARAAFLAERYPDLADENHRAGTDSDDAFDALVSALEIDRRRDELAALGVAGDGTTALEGRIWRPGLTAG